MKAAAPASGVRSSAAATSATAVAVFSRAAAGNSTARSRSRGSANTPSTAAFRPAAPPGSTSARSGGRREVAQDALHRANDIRSELTGLIYRPEAERRLTAAGFSTAAPSGAREIATTPMSAAERAKRARDELAVTMSGLYPSLVEWAQRVGEGRVSVVRSILAAERSVRKVHGVIVSDAGARIRWDGTPGPARPGYGGAAGMFSELLGVSKGELRARLMTRLSTRQYHLRQWSRTFKAHREIALRFERAQASELQRADGSVHSFAVVRMPAGDQKQLTYDLTARIVDSDELPVNTIIVSTWARTGWNVIKPNVLIDATATRNVTATLRRHLTEALGDRDAAIVKGWLQGIAEGGAEDLGLE
jgi:hypothetical protein